MLKMWRSPEANALRVVVAEDDDEECDKHPSKVILSDSELTPEQLGQLTQLSETVQVNPSVGKAWGASHQIDTAGHAPIRSVPYRLAPA